MKELLELGANTDAQDKVREELELPPLRLKFVSQATLNTTLLQLQCSV